jgi:hypothetical protein
MAGGTSNFGEAVEPDALQHPKSKLVAHHLLDGRARYARLTASHRNGAGVETIVLDLDIEVPQAPANAIKPVEPVAIQFHPEDRRTPDVRALREDFPRVPHLNLISEDYPKSLCLYDQPWSDLKLRWTAASFIERIREWMALTARGELHGSDQPLEPILMDWEYRLVLPTGVVRDAPEGAPIRLYVDLVSEGLRDGVLVARGLNQPRPANASAKFVATLLECQPQEHGVIHRAPLTLEDLHALASAAGLDLKARLQETLKGWRDQRDLQDARLIILLWLPKTRSSGAAVEDSDLWAFASHSPIHELGAKLNAWASDGKHNVPLLGDPHPIGPCDTVVLSVLNPHWTLTQGSAARSNGLAPGEQSPFIAIGAGALGSQVLMNLARCGFGKWTIIDDDRLLPHNLARHALDGFAIGFPKAAALSQQMRFIRDSEPGPAAIIADFLEPGDKAAAIDAAIAVAAAILDLSASVPVARALARSTTSRARRISLFLNPSGTDLVMLAEDEARTTTLDHLEHQFYRALLTEPSLAHHFGRDAARLRYAQSCRDVSSTLPHHLAALHAAIGSKAVRDTVEAPAAAIKIWHADSDLQVSLLSVPTSPMIEHSVGGWTVCTDQVLLSKILGLRESKLPNETGGVLIGSFDLERRIVYLVDTIPSPPDSEEWPTLYIRGSAGLANEVRAVSERTAGMLQYVGEWHSHPRHVPPLPSPDDCKVFAWLTELMDRDGFPAIMLIAGDDRQSIFVGKMIQGSEPL